jgi:predicted transcriptional regulator
MLSKVQRDVAYTTVMTTCVRLAEKGLLNREKIGYGYVYTPALGEREFVSCAVADILDAVVRDYPSALTLYLDTRHKADGCHEDSKTRRL